MATEQGSELNTQRSVRFRAGDGDTPTDMHLARRAVFRPSEHIAARRDIIEAFRGACIEDAIRTEPHLSGHAHALFAAAIADEVLGRFDMTHRTIHKLPAAFKTAPDVFAMRRRLHRILERCEDVPEILEQSFLFERRTAKALTALERAQWAFDHHEEIPTVKSWLRKASSEFDVDPKLAIKKMPAFTAIWWTVLRVDTALANKRAKRGAEWLLILGDHPGLAAETRQEVLAQAATWFCAVGDLPKAKKALEVLEVAGGLSQEIQDVYLRVLFDLEARDDVRKYVRRAPSPTTPRDAIVFQMMGANVALDDLSNPLLDRAALDQVREHDVDNVSRIDVVSRNLRHTLTDAERVTLLCELGRAFEETHEADAADVYREALEVCPDHAPAIRALGKLYHRTHAVEELVALYEQEIAARPDGQQMWRRRFQVAQIYEEVLGDRAAALSHYVHVLKQKKNYIPALKGAARLCEETGQWARLAGLFLEAVPFAGSDRQKLYLLDKVANVVEVRLQNLEGAIDAWEEILSLMPNHPNAFSSLGRLYAKTGRWGDLIELNDQEMTLIDDSDEIATLMVRNAEIARDELHNRTVAETYFQRALDHVRDFLPALEGLGRLLVDQGRWDELVSMTESQVETMTDASERYRQMLTLAELVEHQIGDLDVAEELYERASKMPQDNGFALESAMRLKKMRGDWTSVFATLRERKEGDHGYLGHIAEWRLEDPSLAFSFYVQALHENPSELMWLDGISRTWIASGIPANEIADDLENLLLAPMGAEERDAYFLVLARLREISEQTPEASRAYRAHGDRTHFENRAVTRFAVGLAHEVDTLRHLKHTDPIIDLEALAVVPRTRMSVGDVEAIETLAPKLDPDERRWFLRELEVRVGARFTSTDDDGWLGLGREMNRVMEGEGEPHESSFNMTHRFLAVEAKEQDDIDGFRSFTNQEIEHRVTAETSVHRYAELAELVDAEERERIFDEIVAIAFEEETITCVRTATVAFSLFARFGSWGRVVKTTDTFLEKNRVDDCDAVEMLERVGEACAGPLGDINEATTRFMTCWSLSQDLRFLERLVSLALESQDQELAVEYQQMHFDAVISSDHDVQARLMSGFRLAQLLDDVRRHGEAIHHLEELLSPVSESAIYGDVRSLLAKLHGYHGDARRAVAIFEEHLPISPTVSDAADWRELVRIYRDVLDDQTGAYRLQWKLVRAIPTSEFDLETLVDIALDVDELPDCCEQLEVFSGGCADDVRLQLLRFVATTYDEELFNAEQSVRIYSQILEEFDVDENTRVEILRRRAFGLANVTGKELEAIANYRELLALEWFEPSTYRGLSDLYGRVQAFDRARTSKQILRLLNCDVEEDAVRTKTSPSREIDGDDLKFLVMPPNLRDAFDAIRAAAPLIEKAWADELPQRKAMSGDRCRSGRVYEALEDAFSSFGIKKFRVVLGDAGPLAPQVIPDGTIWFNRDFVEHASDGEVRFLAGYAAALAWSDLSSVLSLDGRRIWHLLEGVLFKQTGKGFSDRIDLESQNLAEEFGGPFYAVARRRIASMIETSESGFADVHCEAWPTDLRTFAVRFGAVMCGDVVESVRAAFKLEGWDSALNAAASQERIRRDQTSNDVVKFANSDAFLDTRYAIGLSARPSSFTRGR